MTYVTSLRTDVSVLKVLIILLIFQHDMCVWNLKFKFSFLVILKCHANASWKVAPPRMSKCYFLRTLSNVAFVTKEILPCLTLHNKLALEEEEEAFVNVKKISCALLQFLRNPFSKTLNKGLQSSTAALKPPSNTWTEKMFPNRVHSFDAWSKT